MLGQAEAPDGQAVFEVVLTAQLAWVVLTVNPVGQVTLSVVSVPGVVNWAAVETLAQIVPVVAVFWAMRSSRTVTQSYGTEAAEAVPANGNSA